jgi:hypothetical protein
MYRKSPLGTVVRESLKVILGLFKGDEASKVVETLKEVLATEVKIVKVSSRTPNVSLLTVDPELLDVVKNAKCNEDECYAVVLSWNVE